MGRNERAEAREVDDRPAPTEPKLIPIISIPSQVIKYVWKLEEIQ
ncbi:hypothetical protein [Anaeromonas frigoriresistens]|nr:hypothetical protein [Anaeromonas frigoriresistens]